MAKAIPQKEKMAIIKAIKNGKKRNKIAKEFNRSGSSISKIAKEIGVRFDRSITKKATETRKAYAKESRLEVLADLFQVIKEKLKETENTAKDVFDLSKSLGIAIDKARLEEGEPTEISKGETENVNKEYKTLDWEELPLEVVEKIEKHLRTKSE